MKKVLLVVALLLLATPAFAATTVTAVTEGAPFLVDNTYQQTVRIEYSTTVDVAAFALDINVEPTATFDSIRDYNVGESNAIPGTTGKKGYGIFPSRFRDFITPVNGKDVNSTGGYGWADGNYTPLTAWNEPGTIDPRTGIGFPKMVAELGTLYAGDANKPNLTGTLFRFDVNSEKTPGTLHITIAGNALRGNVVAKDGTEITPVTYVGTSFVIPAPSCTLPNVISMTEAAGTAAITTAGFTLGTRTTSCSDVAGIVAGDIISTNPAAGTVPCGTAIAYVVSTGGCAVAPPVPGSITVPATDTDGNYAVTWTASTGATSYQLESSAPTSGTTIFPAWVQIYSGTALTFTEKVGGGTWTYRVKATNAGGSSAYRTSTNNCAVSACLVGGAAGTSENPDWVKWRYPAAWCYARQCRGDINGKKNVYYVSSQDFTAFTAAYGKTDAQLIAVPNGIAADLNHKKNVYRVSSQDFTVFTAYYGKADASTPLCTAVPIITGPWNYNTVP